MTEIAGILNLTPDSFSGDGLAADAAVSQVDAMMRAGAAMIDVGAESTRPGATLLTPEEEWRRLLPLVEELGSRLQQVPFSLDTRHAHTAAKALESGFRIINDVSGAEDDAMTALIEQHDCRLILMHSLGVPADPNRTLPPDADVVEEVLAWAHGRIAQLQKKGIARAKLIVDPGIGFGKTPLQSFALIKGIAAFKALGTEIMVGHSRKSCLSLFTSKKAHERDPETLAVSCYLAEQGVDYLRVHDVAGHAAMLRIREAL